VLRAERVVAVITDEILAPSIIYNLAATAMRIMSPLHTQNLCVEAPVTSPTRHMRPLITGRLRAEVCPLIHCGEGVTESLAHVVITIKDDRHFGSGIKRWEGEFNF